MTTVQGQQAAISFLLGKQKPLGDTVYRKATFVILTRECGADICYNTLTKELVELSPAEAELLSRDSVCYCEECDSLIEGYFLVPIDHDDNRLCDGVYSFARAAASGEKIKNFTIFTTTDCNARCFYCYEKGIEPLYMSEQTAKKAARFIISASKGAHVNITWYGGEPLMNTAVMDIISGALLEAGVSFSSKIATNGSLFDERLIKHAIEHYKCDKVQITLDGTKEVYDKIKAYTDRESGFSDVLLNIDRLLYGGVKVNIRLNVDSHNVGNLRELVALLPERFSGREGLNVYGALLFDNCEYAKRPLGDREQIARELIEIEELASEGGILHPRRLANSVVYSFCKADAPDSVVITTEGRLVKCDFFTDRYFVGDVEKGIDKGAFDSEILRYSKRLACNDCEAYAVCLRRSACPSGGCDKARRLLTINRLYASVRHLYKKQKKNNGRS